MSESVMIAVASASGFIRHEITTLILEAATHGGGRQAGFAAITGLFPHDAARNRCAREFLKSRADWLLMLDDDVCPPRGLLRVLDLAGEREIICCPYPRADSRGGLFDWIPIEGPRNGQFVELAAGCAGCMFIRRRVLERTGPPWFRFRYDEGGELRESEDFAFCRKARLAGFRVWGTTGPEFECGHVKAVDLLSARHWKWREPETVRPDDPRMGGKNAGS